MYVILRNVCVNNMLELELKHVCCVMGIECESNLLPQGLKCSTDGVDTGSLSGVGQKPPGLLDGFDLWETARSISTPSSPLPGRPLRAEGHLFFCSLNSTTAPFYWTVLWNKACNPQVPHRGFPQDSKVNLHLLSIYNKSFRPVHHWIAFNVNLLAWHAVADPGPWKTPIRPRRQQLTLLTKPWWTPHHN